MERASTFYNGEEGRSVYSLFCAKLVSIKLVVYDIF